MDDTRPLLVLITESFPFRGPDDPFLPREVEVLSRYFDICFVPTRPITRAALHHLAASQTVDVSLASASDRSFIGMSRNMFSSDVARELREHNVRSLRAQAIVARRWSRVRAGKRWVGTRLIPKIGHRRTLVYSWWGVPEALGVAQGLRPLSVPIVIRVHGYDLYPEQESLGFIPFQSRLIDSVERVFSASQMGKQYLQSRYPNFASKITYSYLGVNGSQSLSQSSRDGVLRLVSCSSVDQVKRINVLIDSLLILQARGIEFEWTHIGGDPGGKRPRPNLRPWELEHDFWVNFHTTKSSRGCRVIQ